MRTSVPLDDIELTRHKHKKNVYCKMLLKSLGLKPSLHQGGNKECNLTRCIFREEQSVTDN